MGAGRLAVSAAAVAVVVAGPTAGAAAASSPAPAVAPYLDLGARQPTNLYAAIRHHGLRSFSAAFVIGRGCTPIWDDGVAVSKDHPVNAVIAKAKRLGATAIISFGGASQPELARSCHSKAKLLHAYRGVIKQFHARSIDFDIEGHAISASAHASITRRFQVIHTLEKRDHRLKVSLTVPVTPQGLDREGIALIKAAKRYRARVDLVNLMTMDYGSATAPEMGRAAIHAARHARVQLARIHGHYSYRRVGITPMIGLNDPQAGAPDETFTVPDAAALRAWAMHHHIGRLGFWSLGRDASCVIVTAEPQDDCSSVDQQPFDYTRAFIG